MFDRNFEIGNEILKVVVCIEIKNIAVEVL